VPNDSPEASGSRFNDYLIIFGETLIDLGSAFTSAFASGLDLGSHAPTPTTGLAVDAISAGGEVAGALAVTDYQVSRYQQDLIVLYAPMVADGTFTIDEAVDLIMGANNAIGAGPENVENALRRELDR